MKNPGEIRWTGRESQGNLGWEIRDGRFGLENWDGRPKEDAEGTVGDTGKCEFATGRLWQMQKDLWDIQGDLGKVQNDLGEFKEIFWRCKKIGD
jgi:hypothetical protein